MEEKVKEEKVEGVENWVQVTTWNGLRIFKNTNSTDDSDSDSIVFVDQYNIPIFVY